MIKEVYCSFEVAKLLKEKGFDCPCHATYDTAVTGGKPKFFEYDVLQFFPNGMKNSDDKYGMVISAPTYQMAMAWLREIYHLEINITFGFPFIDGKQQYKYFWSIVRVCDDHLEYPMDDLNSAYYNEEMADSYEEAVESALKYTLENLI